MGSPARVAALLKKIEWIAHEFEQITDEACELSGVLQGEDAEPVDECAALLKAALGCVQRSTKMLGPREGGHRKRTQPSGQEVAAPTVLTLLQSSAGRQVLSTRDTFANIVDPEEKEARELAALRAQFAAGAAEDDEMGQVDWSASFDGGSDDEGGESPMGEYDEVTARRILEQMSISSLDQAQASVLVETWENRPGYVQQGTLGFNEFARGQMRLAGVPANHRVKPPEELAPPNWVDGIGDSDAKPRLQPYQETVAFLCRPQSLPNPRMLVVHRTGCGKTATMIQIADNYFFDRRPKILIFPTNAVCNSFYRELRNPRFPNRYSEYLKRGEFGDARKALELSCILRNGVVPSEFVNHPDLPSAPLRAFSYTMAGGAASCGARPNAVFKCPDGYAGSYPEAVPRMGGYDDFICSGNPFSNKIVLMDEVHNLVCPSAEILRNPKRMLMLQRLRQLLRTAENSVVIGLSGTPLSDQPGETSALLGLIKGRRAKDMSDEGFISYYMDTPLSVFPRLTPEGVLRSLPMLSKLEAGSDEAGDMQLSLRSADAIKLSCISRFCAVAQTFAYAGREDVARTVHGEAGRLLKREMSQVEYGSSMQLKRARGFASKLARIVEDVAQAPRYRTLVLVHRYAGYKLLLRMAAKRLGYDAVCGYPAAKTAAERNDPALARLLGPAHDEFSGRELCQCALCTFNRGSSGAPWLMIADAKECGEGVSFFGVRRLLLADVPSTAEEFVQRIGRAVRFLGHAHLPDTERHVEMRLYVATCKGDESTADEILVERLRGNLHTYEPELRKLQEKAVDATMWAMSEEDENQEPRGPEQNGDDGMSEGHRMDSEFEESSALAGTKTNFTASTSVLTNPLVVEEALSESEDEDNLAAEAAQVKK
ncbi:hypothetical protein AB1Y20_018594 [Prymnesium parvum]|uniref:Helicase ATP-binding domain-containing protein n=1 Tax=Prymnesium parvum TaxID=97485 RepID=A0AB34JSX9_PRYPA